MLLTYVDVTSQTHPPPPPVVLPNILTGKATTKRSGSEALCSLYPGSSTRLSLCTWQREGSNHYQRKLASFPGPAQLSVACSTDKREYCKRRKAGQGLGTRLKGNYKWLQIRKLLNNATRQLLITLSCEWGCETLSSVTAVLQQAQPTVKPQSKNGLARQENKSLPTSQLWFLSACTTCAPRKVSG